MNLPNLLTYARIAAVPIIVALFFADSNGAGWLAFLVFIAASFTDWLDGYIARSRNLESDLGRLLDPIADKVMVAAVLVLLIGFDMITGYHLVAALAILARELAVTGLREFLAERRVIVPVTKLAKWKTGSQMVALVFLLAAAQLPIGSATEIIGLLLLWLSAILTIVTGWGYFKSGLAAALPGTDSATNDAG